jgi:hypothetical protein
MLHVTRRLGPALNRLGTLERPHFQRALNHDGPRHTDDQYICKLFNRQMLHVTRRVGPALNRLGTLERPQLDSA